MGLAFVILPAVYLMCGILHRRYTRYKSRTSQFASPNVAAVLLWPLDLTPLKAARRLWRGDVPLGTAFWGYGTIGPLIIFSSYIAWENSLPPSETKTILYVTSYVISTIYFFFIAVAVWRSAAKYPGSVWWIRLARISVVGTALTRLWDIGEKLGKGTTH